MSAIQITLLITGGIIFVISFFLPAGKKDRNHQENHGNDTSVITEDMVKLMVEREIDDSKSNINEIIDETITYAMEKGERAMERITNEKIMAINEYSDTVLKEIHKNQQEVVFLYDMLNDKHNTLLETVSQATAAASEITKAGELIMVNPETALVATPAAESKTADEPAFSLFSPPRINMDDSRIIKDKPDELKSDMEALPHNVEVQIGSNNNDIILEMHKEGKSNMAIARTLGLGISEVKLVIDLFED